MSKPKYKPIKITDAFVVHLNKQMKKSLNELTCVAYANGVEDAARSLEKRQRKNNVSLWGTQDAASEIRKLIRFSDANINPAERERS